MCAKPDIVSDSERFFGVKSATIHDIAVHHMCPKLAVRGHANIVANEGAAHGVDDGSRARPEVMADAQLPRSGDKAMTIKCAIVTHLESLGVDEDVVLEDGPIADSDRLTVEDYVVPERYIAADHEVAGSKARPISEGSPQRPVQKGEKCQFNAPWVQE
jgi:hypothetical protein